MKVVVVGGHSRNTGKTSVMAELIRSVRPPRWAAVKITLYGHDACTSNREHCSRDPRDGGFTLTDERIHTGRGDTRRFLTVGARRSLWLRVRQGQLPRAFPALLRALRREKWLMIESNSILGLLQPDLYLFVLDRSQRDFKVSAQQYLDRADALVSVGPSSGAHPWPEVDANILESKPTFTVSPSDYSSEELNRFVRQKLGLPDPEGPRISSG